MFAHYVLGFGWTLAGVVGAALAPTDPAVMFSVLGGREIAGRSGTTLEGEAGVNDPAGIALMIGLIEFATHDGASLFAVVREFAVEMVVGTAMGLLGALVLLPLLRLVRLPSEGLYPVLALALAGCLYSATALLHGSGFLAVFVALGLTVNLGSLTGRVWLEGILLALALALLVRPLVVAATLAGSRLRWSERAFTAWSGLKGAVAILLAAFAVLGGVADADHVYGIVFVVVLASVVGQGTLVPRAASLARIPMHQRPPRPWHLTVDLDEEPEGAEEFTVVTGSDAEGKRSGTFPLATTPGSSSSCATERWSCRPARCGCTQAIASFWSALVATSRRSRDCSRWTSLRVRLAVPTA